MTLPPEGSETDELPKVLGDWNAQQGWLRISAKQKQTGLLSQCEAARKSGSLAGQYILLHTGLACCMYMEVLVTSAGPPGPCCCLPSRLAKQLVSRPG